MGRSSFTSPAHSLHRPAPHLLNLATLSPAAAAISAHEHSRFYLEQGTIPAAAAATASPPPAVRCHPPRAESTRVRLQRQRLSDHHAAVVVSQRLPGLKTSTAFFASLRTNLRLNACPPPSPLATPTLLTASTGYLPPPSPLSSSIELLSPSMDDSVTIAGPDFSSVDDDPLAGVPELTSYTAETAADKQAALRLIADSAAQMRQTANRALLLHPLNLALAVALLALVVRGLQLSSLTADASLLACTAGGVVAAVLLLCRWATQGHLAAAERLDSTWLAAVADDVLVTRFGDEVIAALVLAWLPADPASPASSASHTPSHSSGSASSNSPPPSTSSSSSPPSSSSSRRARGRALKGEIRAWTVRLKYRRKGVGAALLDEAVREARRRGAEALAFAAEHANSTRVLPWLYNAAFDRRELRAHQALHAALDAAAPLRSRRKRGGSS